MIILTDLIGDLIKDEHVTDEWFGHLLRCLAGLCEPRDAFTRAIVSDIVRVQDIRAEKAVAKSRAAKKRWGANAEQNRACAEKNVHMQKNFCNATEPNRTEPNLTKQTEAESRACAREEVSDSASETSASVEISQDLSESSASASAKILQSIMKPDTKGKEQFVRTLRTVCAKKNEDALVGLATAFCGDASILLADRAYRKRLKEVGFGNFANELEMFAADCFAGEEPKNRGAAFSARLKKLAEDLGR